MRYLGAAEYPFIALLLLSLAGKVVTNTGDQPAPIAERIFASAVVQQASERGFSTRVEYWPSGVVVHARRGDCQMWVRDYSPHGTYRNTYEALAEPLGSLRYIYKDEISEDPPKLDPLLRYFFRREMLRLGVHTPKYPIYAVAWTASCDRSGITWPASIS